MTCSEMLFCDSDVETMQRQGFKRRYTKNMNKAIKTFFKY